MEVLTTQEAGRVGTADSEQLAFAVREGRTIFTMDEDFLEMASRIHQHAGIVFLAQRRFTVGQAVHGLFRLWETRSPEAMAGQIEFL